MIQQIRAILWKQIKDTFKNKTILIQFIMFPILTLIMENTVKIQGMPEHFFASLFAVMYVGMAPLTSMSAILSEEKEKNTLRVLMMTNVSPTAYLLGIGVYVWFICMIGACIIALAGQFTGSTLLQFLLIMGVGILVSLVIGAAIGVWSKNQMMATSITVPVMMVFSFLPMLSMFNEQIGKLAQFTYSEQIYRLINQAGTLSLESKQVGIIACNMMIAIVLFVIAYRRSGLAS